MSRPVTHTDLQWKEAVACSKSIAQTLKTVGLVPRGGNYKIFYRKTSELKLDYSHFEKSSNRVSETPRVSLEEALTCNPSHVIQTTSLKKRLLAANLLKEECALCGIDSWRNNPLVLHLDHINGLSFDNRIENLRLLCPNCHSQTDTYTGRNNKGKYSHKCKRCQTPIKSKRIYCDVCRQLPRLKTKIKPRPTKIAWPSDEELSQLVWKLPIAQIAIMWKISGNAIAKRCRKRSIPVPGRGYWSKLL